MGAGNMGFEVPSGGAVRHKTTAVSSSSALVQGKIEFPLELWMEIWNLYID